MKIRLIPSARKYGKAFINMPEINVNIETVNQLIESIRDGYIPVISWSDTKSFLYEMMYNVIDHSFKYSYRECMGVIEAITNYYFSTKDFYESDAIMTFKRFLETGILNFQEV